MASKTDRRPKLHHSQAVVYKSLALKALTQNLSLFAAGFGIGLAELDHYGVKDAILARFLSYSPGIRGA
jgi:hypothetical protein